MYDLSDSLWLLNVEHLSVCVCERREAGCVLCADAFDWRINSLRCSFQREREGERERGAGGARHLHPRGRWMGGEMEEGRGGDKQRQRRQGSVKEMEEGGEITALPSLTKRLKAQTSHPAF